MTTIWDVASGKPQLRINRLRATRPVAFSPDGKLLVAGSSGHSGFLWVVNATNGHVVAETDGHDNLLFSTTFSPDGKTIASASSDGTVKFWTLEPILEQVAGAGKK